MRFIVIALARGESEAWSGPDRPCVQRTGINRCRRAACRVAELDLGDLGPLEHALPERAPAAARIVRGDVGGGEPWRAKTIR